MELLKDWKLQLLGLIFIIFLAGIYFYPLTAGILIMLALFTFGIISLTSKEPRIKLAGLIFLVLLSLANIGLNGMKFGIDFEGGTRIPVLLETPASGDTMSEMVSIIKKRSSILALSETRVRAIGDSQIYVEVPFTDETRIKMIEDTLTKQGIYQAVIDGKEAINGAQILSATIRRMGSNELLYTQADWGVGFSVNREGAEQFAKTAKGKADYPVYLFLDRPAKSDLFLTRTELKSKMLEDSSEKESLNALKKVLELDKGNISIFIIEDVQNISLVAPGTKALIGNKTSSLFKADLIAAGYNLTELTEEEMTPIYNRTTSGVLIVNKFEAIGLRSAPLLSAGLATGLENYGFSITGGSKGTTASERAKNAEFEAKQIESVLKGGSLPIPISLGSRTTLPATLGSEFLKLSLIGIISSLIAISVLIGLRYRNIKATLPIIIISISELAILLAILGSFSIDLAAMAGIIAAIGVGVDAQIVITDEILKKDEYKMEEKMDHAFSIIRTNVIVASLSMIPLLFSGVVEVIGFAISTIMGAILGYLLTRPAYATIVEMIIGKKDGS